MITRYLETIRARIEEILGRSLGEGEIDGPYDVVHPFDRTYRTHHAVIYVPGRKEGCWAELCTSFGGVSEVSEPTPEVIEQAAQRFAAYIQEAAK